MARNKKKNNKKSQSKTMTTNDAGSIGNAAAAAAAASATTGQEDVSNVTVEEDAVPNATVGEETTTTADEKKESCCGKKNSNRGDSNGDGNNEAASLAADSNSMSNSIPAGSCCSSKAKTTTAATAETPLTQQSKQPAGSCCANKQKKTVEEQSKPSSSPPISGGGACCSNKKSTTHNNNNNNNNNNNSNDISRGTSTPTRNGTCCGCGDNCRACIENGWSFCHCGPNCTCSDPLLEERASLLLGCAGQKQSSLEQEENQQQSGTTTDQSFMMEVHDPLRNAAASAREQHGSSDPEAQKEQSLFVDIIVGGMTCTMCSQAIVNTLQMVEGVSSVNVSLTTDVAHVVLDPNKVTDYNAAIEEIQDNIQDIGYTVVDVLPMPQKVGNTTNSATKGAITGVPETQKDLFVDIVVGGMTCTMCSQAIINALEMMDGVSSVNVSLTTDVAHVVIDPQKVTNYDAAIEEIQETIQDIGYTVVDVLPMPQNKEPGNDNGDNGDTSTEPLGATNNAQQDRWDVIARRQEEKLHQKRGAFLWSLVGTLPILFLTMILPHVLPQSSSAVRWWYRQHVHLFHKDIPVGALIMWLLDTPVQFICGWEFYKSSYYGLFRTGTWGMDVLIVLGTTSSYCYALYGMLSNKSQEAHFFETSAVLISFVLLGKWMQALAVHRTSAQLSQLMKLQPSTAIRVVPLAASMKNAETWNPIKEAYQEEVIPTNRLQRGDVVKIVPGASLPADGVVIVGELAVDESMVTGESIPVLKTKGSVVLGGTICVESSTLEDAAEPKVDDKAKKHETTGQVAFCRVTGVGSSTALAQIIKLVQDAQASKVPMQNFADTVSSVFVPVVVTLSLITFLVWYALCSSAVVPEKWYTHFDESPATFSLMFGIACLVISCPCALGLATPTAVMVGTGVGAKLGILMKGGEALEAASKVNAVVLDKTGTVTTGKPVVTDFIRLADGEDIGFCSEKKKEAPTSVPSKRLSKETILWLLGSLERSSEHPLAKAIVGYAEQQLSDQKKNDVTYLEEKPFLQPSDFRSLTGRGASGYVTIDSRNGSTQCFVAVGNRAFFSSLGMDLTLDIDAQMKKLEERGKTAILAAIDNHFCVVLGVADQLRPDAAQSVAYLRQMKIDVWMVTGDNARTAQAIARQLNLPPQRVVSEALPNAKVHQVQKLQQQGKIVAMVGDGTNDAPALAQANVGIGMGTGTAIAAEAADMVLVSGQHLADVCAAFDLCRVIFARIKWNFLWSLIYNCLGIPVAAGVFFPLLHTRLPPTVAAMAMALSSVSVVFSSLALRLYKPPFIASYSLTTTHSNSARTSRTASPSRASLEAEAPERQGTAQQVSNLTLDMGSNDTERSDLAKPLLANDHLPTIGGEV